MNEQHLRSILAKALRSPVSAEENLLAEALRASGVYFQRQRRIPVNSEFREQEIPPHYRCDFYLPRSRLDVECDGQTHRLPENLKWDTKRDSILRKEGYHVLRIQNYQIRQNVAKATWIVTNQANWLSNEWHDTSSLVARREGSLL